MPQAAAAPITGRPHARRAVRLGQRLFAVSDRWVDDCLRHGVFIYRLLNSPLLGLPGVQRLTRQRFRRSAFADVHATRALLQQATERASAILTPRQALALQLFATASRWPSSRRGCACAAASTSGGPTDVQRWKP